MFDVIIQIFESFFDPNFSITSPVSTLVSGTYSALIQGPADEILNSDLIANVYNILIPVGLILMMIGFGISLTEIAMDQQISAEQIVKKFIVLIISILILDNGMIVGAGQGWIEKIYEYTMTITDDYVLNAFNVTQATKDSLTGSYDAILDSASATDPGLLQQAQAGDVLLNIIGKVICVVVFSVLGALPAIFVLGVGIIRAVKLGIYISMAPIAIACHYTKTPLGMSYIKTIVALFVQQLIIVLSTKMVIVMSARTVNPFTIILAMISLIGTILSSEQKAKELLK